MTLIIGGMCYRSLSAGANRLTCGAPHAMIHSSLERTNQPRTLGQATRRSEYHSQAEPRLTHAPEPDAVMAEGKPGEQESDGVFALVDAPGKCRKHRPGANQRVEVSYPMTTENTNPNLTEAPELWCPNCGCHLDVYHEDYMFHGKLGSARITSTIGTCRNPECVMFEQTLSPDSWMDEARLLRYSPRVKVQFDVRTGLTTQVVDQTIGNQIAWLMSQYTPDEAAAFEQWIAVHFQDDDFNLMIAAFVEGITPAPDYSAVCDTHLEGR